MIILFLISNKHCPDLRNSRIVDIVSEMKQYNIVVDVYDPWACVKEAEHEYDIKLINKPKTSDYDAVILAVAHEEFKQMGGAAILAFGKPISILYDLKYVLSPWESDLRL